MSREEEKFLPTWWITQAHTRQVLANKNWQGLTLDTQTPVQTHGQVSSPPRLNVLTWHSQRPSACICCWQPRRYRQSHLPPRHPAAAAPTQEAVITEWMWLWDRGQVSRGLHFTVPFKPRCLFIVSLRKQLLWTRMMLNTHFLILRWLEPWKKCYRACLSVKIECFIIWLWILSLPFINCSLFWKNACVCVWERECSYIHCYGIA